MSTTKIGYIPVEDYRNVDLALIPAMFAAMIGGYKMVIPLGLIWGGVSYANHESDMWVLGLTGALVIKIGTVFLASFFYKYFKKKYLQSPDNVYRTLIATIILKVLIFNSLFFFIYMGGDFNSLDKEFLLNSLYITIMEIALCCLAMKMLIKHLRQIHILNGVKRKEKRRRKKGEDKKC